MYEQFIAHFRANYPKLPTEPTLELGLAIKHIRLRMGLTQDELARDSKVKLSALKTLENGYAKFTKASTLEALARVLRTTVPEIVPEAREWFPGNFLVLSLTSAEHEVEHTEGNWYKRKPLAYRGFTVDFSSPPPVSPAHFSFATVEIEPDHQIRELKLPYANQVAGFLSRGTVKVIYDSTKEIHLFGNQGFVFRGDKVHDFINLDKDNPARLCLAFTTTPSRNFKEEPKAKSTPAQ